MQPFNPVSGTSAKWIGGGVLLLLILIYFYGRIGGKRKGSRNAVVYAPVPDPTHIDPALDVAGLSGRLHYQMNGVSWWWDNDRRAVMFELLNLNDSEFVAVYNHFNANHGDGNTLREWIVAEQGLGSNLELQLTNRFQSLNLS